MHLKKNANQTLVNSQDSLDLKEESFICKSGKVKQEKILLLLFLMEKIPEYRLLNTRGRYEAFS